MVDFQLLLQRKIYKRNIMVRTIKAAERAAFPQQTKQVKALQISPNGNIYAALWRLHNELYAFF
jgi:hypothetical protein